VASSDTAVATVDTGITPDPSAGYNSTTSAYVGCLPATGQERLLARYLSDPTGTSTASDFLFTGTFIAFIESDRGFQ
jgi:subtilisin family serine protease